MTSEINTKIFMCPPTYYSVDYKINPWMKIGEGNNNIAIEAWTKLRDIIKNDVGAEVLIMEPQKGLPDIVFTANAALIYKKTAVISRFRFQERQPEAQFYADWLENKGYKVEFLPEDICFEGAGDALFDGDTLFSGYVPRSDISSHAYISNLLNIQVLSLELIDPRFYHLDTCFCPMQDGFLLYYPGAFDEYGNKVIENHFNSEKRIAVTEEEACTFTCNAVNIGYSIITNRTTERLKEEFTKKGFKHYEVDLGEFLKAGGSAKCLTLKLNYYENR